jgi:ABC-type transport system involved in multi-copper enzyme maturation permease subunit
VKTKKKRLGPVPPLLLLGRQTFAIAAVTFQELLREKVLWSALVFAFLCVGLAYAVSQLSFADNARIALDFGLASISIVGGLISIIMGAALIAKEIHNRTLYVVLTKSVWRWQFVLGRFGGLVGVLSVNALLMALVLLVVQHVAGGSPDASLVKSLLLQVTEFAVLAATACMFSALSTATLAAIFSAGIWVIGHANADLKILASKIEPVVLRPVLDFVARALPDLARFDIKAEVSHQLPVTWAYVTTGMAYGCFYAAFALTAACLIFMRRDL